MRVMLSLLIVVMVPAPVESADSDAPFPDIDITMQCQEQALPGDSMVHLYYCIHREQVARDSLKARWHVMPETAKLSRTIGFDHADC
jgi:hypothetical protein